MVDERGEEAERELHEVVFPELFDAATFQSPLCSLCRFKLAVVARLRRAGA